MDPQRLRQTIESAQAGSAGAYEQLLASYGPRLYGYFVRATGNHHDSEDLLSEVSLRLVRQLKSYDDRGRFEPWLFRIAANLVRDRIRRVRSSPPALSLSVQNEDGGSPHDELAGDHTPVDAGVLNAEAAGQLNAALDRLDEASRQMILLRHFGQMSFREIADLMECPLGTVLAKVHRGLATLRRVMTKHEA